MLYLKLILCNGFAEIYAQLEGSGGQSAIGICAFFYIYIYRSAMRCGKFGVLVFKASMLNWKRGWVSICHRYMCIVLYIYRSAMGCANFGVAVFQASVLDCWGPICHGYMCIVLYMKLMWCNGFAQIYAHWRRGSI